MKILVIRFKAVGDVILTSTICSTLKKSFPDSQIDYLVYAPANSLFENHKDIDNVITLTSKGTKNPFKYIKMAWNISRANYDVVIDVTSTPKSELISLFSRKAKFKIGRKKHGFGKGFFYTHKITAIAEQKVQQKMDMLKPLIEAGHQIIFDKQLRINIDEKEKQLSIANIESQGVDVKQLIFAFSVSAKYAHKMWNLDYMAEVAQHCLKQYNAQIIVLTGMPHERETINGFKQRLNGSNRVFNEIEAPSLRDLAILLANCDLYIGNEGGPRHIAEGVGIPTVSVTSPEFDYRSWIGRGRSNHQSIDWRDIPSDKTRSIEGVKSNDPYMLELRDTVKPEHVIKMVDNVVKNHLK